MNCSAADASAHCRDFINTVCYSHTALWLNGAGCLVWVLAYAALVRNIVKKKFVEMPFLVAGANIAWELTWSVLHRPCTGTLFWLMYIGACGLDVFIVWSLFKYGPRQVTSPWLKPLFPVVMVGNFLLWLGFLIWWEWTEGLKDDIGANSGYLINLVLSVLCLHLFVRAKDPSLFSKVIGVSRTAGTGLISISLVFIYPDAPLLRATTVACFLIDAVYVGLLFKRRAPWW